MIVSTRAIVINYTRYSDSSIIAHLFTESLGRVSVMVYGMKNKKQNKLVAFQSLFLLDIELDYKPNRNIQVLKEHRISPPLMHLTGHVIKSSIALFLAEILNKSLKEEAADTNIFSFLQTSVEVLDQMDEGIGIFHLSFLTKLSRYLGFSPDENNSNSNYFDIKTMLGTQIKPSHKFYLNEDGFKHLILMYNTGYDELSNIKLSIKDRNELLEAIIQIYEVHSINFNTLKSFEIFKQVFS